MATIPPPNSVPESPPSSPDGIPGEITPPGPDIDVPDPNPGDPGDPLQTPDS